MNSEEVRETQDKLIKINQEIKELTSIFLDGKAYDLSRINVEIKSYLQHAAWAKLEIGKRFVVIKEMEGHGNWLNWLQTNYDFIEPKTAQRWMNAATKLARHNLNTTTMPYLPLRKIYLLMQAPDDELEELAKKGSIRGMKLDDIDKLPYTELKEKFRKTLDQVDEGKKQLEKVEQENERLRERKDESEEIKPNNVEIAFSKMIGITKNLLNDKETTQEMWDEAKETQEAFIFWSGRLKAKFNRIVPGYEPIDGERFLEEKFGKVQDEKINAE